MRRIVPLLAAISALSLAACTSASSDASRSTSSSAPTNSTGRSPSTTDTRGGIQPGYPTDVDRFSPLVITTIAPDPIPFTGTDGKVHVAYELQVLNDSPRPATITRIETLQGGPDGKVLATVPQDEVVARAVLVGNHAATPSPFGALPPGRAGLLLIDDIYATRTDVPVEVTHRVSATFGDVPPGQADFATKYPVAIEQIGGPVRASTQSPVIIGAPLAGNDWLASNACCTNSSHRGAMLPVGGRISGTERYAIDWARIDVAAPGLLDQATGRPATFKGDVTKNDSYLAHGQPLLAVADGTVVAVTADQPEAAPQTTIPDLRLDQLGGNIIILDIGNGVFAFYAHAIPGATKVKVGDRVTKGQTISTLGNSGNTSEAHLHFHLMRAPVPLSADNVPFEIEQLTFVGSAIETGLEPGPDAGPRTNQYPLADAITNFPPVKP